MTTFLGFHTPQDGYGIPTMEIAAALQARDPAIGVIDMTAMSQSGAPQWTIDDRVVALCTPDWYPKIEARELIGYTMFEASELPRGWVTKINACCQSVLVPSPWCREIFTANGVLKPIGVVPWALNAQHFNYQDRPADRLPFTFLWSGTPDLRKGWDVTYAAFDRAFRGRSDVNLLMHFRAALPGQPTFADPNVEMIVGKVDRAGWLDMLQRADAFVFPSRGEGWGLPPREAAATGLPVIATYFGGMAFDLLNWGLPVRVGTTPRPAAYGFWEDGTLGTWPEPDVDDCAAQMIWCVEHRTAALLFGRSAAAYQHLTTWADTAATLLLAAEGVKI